MKEDDDRVYCVQVNGGVAFRFQADRPSGLDEVSEQARAWMTKHGFVCEGEIVSTVIPRHRN